MRESAGREGDGRRIFIAVALPLSVRAALFAAIGELADELPGVSWARKVENLHLTLKFLGKISNAQLGALCSALASRVKGVRPVPVRVRGVGAFPSDHRANVVWAGLKEDETDALSRIAIAVQSVALDLGIGGIGETEHRPFRAHVTIGRAKRAVDARNAVTRMAGREFGQFTVDGLHVYESHLGTGIDLRDLVPVPLAER